MVMNISATTIIVRYNFELNIFSYFVGDKFKFPYFIYESIIKTALFYFSDFQAGTHAFFFGVRFSSKIARRFVL